MVKWSACLPFIPMIRVRIYSFSVKIVVEKYENKQKEGGIGPFINCTYTSIDVELANLTLKKYFREW